MNEKKLLLHRIRWDFIAVWAAILACCLGTLILFIHWVVSACLHATGAPTG